MIETCRTVWKVACRIAGIGLIAGLPLFGSNGAKAAFLVYDITNRASFDNIKKWYDDLMAFTDAANFILVGNKVDLADERAVTREEGSKMASEIAAGGFLEVSAKDNIEIDEAFNDLAKFIMIKTNA